LAIDFGQKISCLDELGDVRGVPQDHACKVLGFSHLAKWHVFIIIMDASKPFLSFGIGWIVGQIATLDMPIALGWWIATNIGRWPWVW
jgi:hypothetical protein